jgi:hypothetical protein
MDEKCCAMRILFLKCSHSLKLTGRQHHVCAEQSSPSWIAFVLKRHSLEFSFSIETYFVITLFWSAEAWQL